LSGSREPEPEHPHVFEFLGEVQDDANRLDDDLRRAVAEIVVALHANPYLGELMDDRWPQNLERCRKVRFDRPGWTGKPRYRLIYRNEPTDGAVSTMVVLAIERRSNMIAYARASSRLARREATKYRRGRMDF
jgi:hypothetical protein